MIEIVIDNSIKVIPPSENPMKIASYFECLLREYPMSNFTWITHDKDLNDLLYRLYGDFKFSYNKRKGGRQW